MNSARASLNTAAAAAAAGGTMVSGLPGGGEHVGDVAWPLSEPSASTAHRTQRIFPSRCVRFSTTQVDLASSVTLIQTICSVRDHEDAEHEHQFPEHRGYQEYWVVPRLPCV